MQFSVREVMDVLCTISTEQNLRLTVTQAARGGMMAGGGAFVGAIIGGPVGMAIGGTVGAIAGAATSKDFKPLAVVLKQLPAHKKRELTDRINRIVASVDYNDFITLLALVQGSASLRMQVINALQHYFAEVEQIPIQP